MSIHSSRPWGQWVQEEIMSLASLHRWHAPFLGVHRAARFANAPFDISCEADHVWLLRGMWVSLSYCCTDDPQEECCHANAFDVQVMFAWFPETNPLFQALSPPKSQKWWNWYRVVLGLSHNQRSHCLNPGSASLWLSEMLLKTVLMNYFISYQCVNECISVVYVFKHHV